MHRLESIKPESSRSKSELESIKPESSRSKQSFMVYHHFSTIHLHSNIYFLEISFNFKHVRLALSHVYHTWFYVHIINILLSAFISYLHNISIFLSATSFILAKISSIPKIQKLQKKNLQNFYQINYLFLTCTFRFPEWILIQHQQKAFGPQLFHIFSPKSFFLSRSECQTNPLKSVGLLTLFT